MRFHILGLAHTKTNIDYITCAYTQKVFKLCKMLKNEGHHVFHYGAEGSNPDCDERVTVISDDLQNRVYGEKWKTNLFSFDKKDDAYIEFNKNAIIEINLRKKDDDFILASFGNFHKPITDAIGLYLTVEPGIGYEGVYSNFRVFESYAWMHHVYGLLKQRQGSWYDCVIPNYFDLDDFTFEPVKKDYFLFVGRLREDKGLQIAIDVCREIKCKLKIAGSGDLNKFKTEGIDVEYLGVVDRFKRSEYMKNAKALFVPTYYLEPFGGVNIEAQLSGTPVITTDWGAFPETVLHGVTGYRCRTFDDFIWAALHVDKLDPETIRKWASENYSIERISKMYNEYFSKLYDLNTNKNKGWYNINNNRTELDWLKKF